ncbi:MAG TPA: histidine kinase N-terminal domain-containing protein [Acidimicrobiales bacterium]|nr:histidine kinase N-terminal domain-containing protein [Acidimicrobiales bacterium]
MSTDAPALTDEAQAHLQRLMATWGMLADLCFADLLLCVPTDAAGTRFMVYGQMRPSTSQTLYLEDLVGWEIEAGERPLVARAWSLGEIVEGEIKISGGDRARVQCIPVRWKGEMIAVLTREAPLVVGGRRPGELERIYVDTFERLARMIVRGEFPHPVEDAPTTESPRVGDGVLSLDATGRVAYASPNAVNALHRMGIYSNVVGLRLDELGVEETAVQKAFFGAVPVTEEIERHGDVIVLLRCIPLLEAGDVNGALVLLRDVTDLRRRDRLLLSKDATIREVHHRVKNNLQTISSLLRLQARRLPHAEARTALEEAGRRIRSMALVHEILSRDPSQQVPFNEIIDPLVRMAQDAVLTPGDPVSFEIEGDAGELPAELATPLAVVLTELLQNAVEHAFPESLELEGGRRVSLVLHNDGHELVVRVQDNGRGLPVGFSVEGTNSLGLSIVRGLVIGQLGGSMSLRSEGGTVVELRIPVATPEPA